MIKIKDLKVKNFKSLVDTEIESFGKVNLFYGFNNCGKSNVFKFLKMLFQTKVELESVDYESYEDTAISQETRPTNKGFWNGKIYNEPFIFSDNNNETDIDFDITLLILAEDLPEVEELSIHGFISNETPEQEVNLMGRIVYEELSVSSMELQMATLNGNQFYDYEDRIESFFDDVESDILTDKVGEAILTLFNDCVLLIDTDRNFRSELLQDSIDLLGPETFKNWMFELNINSEKNHQFVALERFLSDFDFSATTKEKIGKNIQSFPFRDSTKIGFTKIGNEIEIMLENSSGRFPVRSFGTGVQQFFYLMARIFMNKSRIIIIEELELNLAPIFQKELLRFISGLMPSNCDQILFSSHSPFFTKKNSELVDYVQFVQIDNSVLHKGTTIESWNEWTYDEEQDSSYFSFFYA